METRLKKEGLKTQINASLDETAFNAKQTKLSQELRFWQYQLDKLNQNIKGIQEVVDAYKSQIADNHRTFHGERKELTRLSAETILTNLAESTGRDIEELKEELNDCLGLARHSKGWIEAVRSALGISALDHETAEILLRYAEDNYDLPYKYNPHK